MTKEKNPGSKVVFINENHKRFGSGIREGGLSRNMAWERWLREKVKDLSECRIRKGKILHHFQVFGRLLFSRNATIFFLYPFLGVPVFYLNRADKALSDLFFKCLRIALKRNRVVFDISDLKHEQAIDLNLTDENRPVPFEEIEKKLFSTEALFIFASHRMRDYACRKYGIPEGHTDVCINGGGVVRDGAKIPITPDPGCLNAVYAGTLNKGRQIEELMAAFPADSRLHLYLLGAGGEWIPAEISGKKENITYLGALEEEAAHRFVSLCDIGLIPYDESRLYYHLAYPTKLSFYVTAGIPYISTPVGEAEAVDNEIHGGWLAPVSKWKPLIAGLTGEDISEKKRNILEKRDRFYWDNVFDQNRFIH